MLYHDYFPIKEWFSRHGLPQYLCIYMEKHSISISFRIIVYLSSTQLFMDSRVSRAFALGTLSRPLAPSSRPSAEGRDRWPMAEGWETLEPIIYCYIHCFTFLLHAYDDSDVSRNVRIDIIAAFILNNYGGVLLTNSNYLIDAFISI